ncbi:unnamed protein product [Dovyalis caffra]|uniref:Uncharacterized protein n=1 Tax=Dovyalis caffra TaxID=77055 RepID=A0AAV1SCN1_9ROSI|nr:unnamed protein product [Dovyalis caffra]
MVETRRSSSSSKRSLPPSSPPPSSKRCKAAVAASASEVSSSTSDAQLPVLPAETTSPEKESGCVPPELDPQATKPEEDKSADAQGEELVSLDEITAGEKSKTAVVLNKSKKRLPKSAKSNAKVAWGQLLSQCSQIFQQLTSNSLSPPGLPSVSILEAHSAPIKGIHIEARSRDPSDYAGASILASLSHLLPPAAKAGEDVQQSTEFSTLPSGCEASEDRIPDVEMKDGTSNNDNADVSPRDKTVVPSSNAAKENANVDSMRLGACTNAVVGRIPNSTYELKPLLQILAGSSSEFDKIFDEKERREILKDLDPLPVLMSTRRQLFKDSLQKGILNPEEIEVSFDSFPYYLRCTFSFVK